MAETPSVGFQITSDPDTTSVASPDAGSARGLDPGGAFRLVLISDLDPQAPPCDWAEGVRTHAVDAASLPDVMRKISPRLEVSVPDHLGTPTMRRTLAWTADALEAFTPSGIVARIPELAALSTAREALGEARRGQLSLDALRERLRATGVDGAESLADAVVARPDRPSTQADSDDALGRLLGMVSIADTPDAAPPAAPPSALDALVGAAVGPTSGIDSAAVDRVMAGLDSRIGAQVIAVLDHPDVRRAEAAWRGLRFLCDRMAFRKGARLDVLASSRSELDAAIHFQVLLPEHSDGLGRAPLAAIVIDHAFGATSADLVALGDLAATGGSLQVPVITSAAPSFFGLDGPTDFSRLQPVGAMLDRQEYAAFRSIRLRPEAKQLALAVPSFVLRPPYGPEHPDRSLTVSGGETLWGNGALLAAAAMAVHHASSGWPMPSAGTVVGDLIVRKTRMGALPLSAAFGESILQDLGRAGLLGFSGPLQTDRAVVGPSATTARAADNSFDAQAQASLPASVFSALAAHRALRIGHELAGADMETALAEIDARFRAFLRGDGPPPEDAVTVQYLEEHETETSRTYGVRLRPPSHVISSPIGVVMGVEVEKEAHADGA